MPRYRLDSIAQLARQLGFAPHEVRTGQLAAAESLLHLIDPAKAYPIDFVTYRITDYRPKLAKTELLTGLALQHDLGLLIESVSDTLDLHASELTEPVLAIDDVCERFNVTSKTIQRWRRKGLPARRFIFADGKRRVGFLLTSVERFVGAHQEQVAPVSNFSQINDAERTLIVRHARRLAVQCGCSIDELTHRIARRTNRSPLTILHTLRKHDQEHPGDAILPHAAPAVQETDRVAMLKAFRRGVGIAELSARYNRPRASIYHSVMAERMHRLLKRKARFHDDPLFHERNAEHAINAIVAQEAIGEEPSREELRVPRDLPPYFQELYRTPLLSRSRERALFLKLNFHKYQFSQTRRRLDPESARHRDLCLLEAHLARAAEVKNAIVRANLRLVVSIARKHLRGNLGLLELVSEGNITLMRAVDGFDVGRGHRFSTYATFALMKGFARSVPQMLTASRRAAAGGGDDEMLAQVADRHDGLATDRLIQRDELDRLLSRLDSRERSVVAAHYGLDGGPAGATYEQVGRRLGISKERVRQIEQSALAKLRAAARAQG